MGGRGGSSGLSNARQKIDNSIETIRNAKHENLLVFDLKGNIVYREGGTQGHTGYNDVDYKDKIVAHNHPKGYAPYPSDTDFDTFQKHDSKEMIIVSKDYTVSVKKDPNFKSLSGIRGSISTNARYMGKQDIDYRVRQGVREGKYNTKTANEVMRNEMFDLYKRAAKRAGYIMTVKKRK